VTFFAERASDPRRTGSTIPARCDNGMTMIEVLVAVILLGIGGAATMTALGASISGTTTLETKIAGLAMIETAASGLTRKVEPCNAAAYQFAARAAVPKTGWGSSALGSSDNMTATVACGAAFDVVTLTYTAPNGRGSHNLRLTLGGPTMSSTAVGGGAGTPAPTIGDSTCEFVSLTATPPTVKWQIGQRVLDEDVKLSVQLAGNCGLVRARFSPMNNGAFVYLPLSSSRILVVPGRADSWLEGVANVGFEHELTGWRPMNGPTTTFRAFVVDQCVLSSVSTTPSTVTLDESGKLTASVAVTAAASGSCDGLTWNAATGIGDARAGGALTWDGATTVTGSVTGGSTSEIWAVGPKSLDIVDRHGNLIGTAAVEMVRAATVEMVQP
jgi:prepilin-type N-terminal cleavage/methylation domain-containing protein